MVTNALSKLDDHIRKVQQLRELLADPAMAALAAQILGSNGNGNYTSQISKAPDSEGITAAVSRVVPRMLGKFTINDVKKILEGEGYNFTASNATMAIGSVLRRLTERHALRVISEQNGRQAKTFERIEKVSTN